MRANAIPAACVALLIALLCLPATARTTGLGALPAAEAGTAPSTFTIALPIAAQHWIPGATLPMPTPTRTLTPAPTATPTVTATPPVTGSGLLRVSSDGHFLLDGHPFVMKGFNYYPRNYPWCAMATWDWQEVDTELALGASLGANTVRTFVDYSFCTDNPWEQKDVHTYYHPTPACLQALDRFLQLADQHGLKAIVLFSASMPGWAIMDNGEYWIIEAYLDELVPPFAGDRRIAAWDVLNEGDYSPELWGTPMEKVVAYERAAADHLHSIDPNHLVTAHRAYAGYAHETQDYVDYVTFHGYQPLYGLRERIQQLRSRLLRPMPLVMGEYGFPSAGQAVDTFPLHLQWLSTCSDVALLFEKLDGALFWELMDHNWPSTPLTHANEDNVNWKFGVFGSDLTPKLSAGIIRSYFTGQYGVWNQLLLQYSQLLPSPDGLRYLSLALRSLDFLDSSGALVQRITFGTNEANLLQGYGWYYNEDWGQWIGDPGMSASLYVAAPAGATSLRLNMWSYANGNQVQVWYAGRLLGSVVVNQPGGEFTFGL